MIYLFGSGNNVSIVYNEKTLSTAQKSKATLILDKLPPTNCPDGYIARASLKNGIFEWVYEVKEEEVKEDG